VSAWAAHGTMVTQQRNVMWYDYRNNVTKGSTMDRITHDDDRFAGLAAVHYGAGTGSGPPLVLLHGLTFDCTMWAPCLEALSRCGHEREVLALDLPGHGDSLPRESYELDLVSEQVMAAVESAGITAPVLVGHSVSGVIATIAAARHRVSGVVNVDQPLLVEPFATRLQHAFANGASALEMWEAAFSTMGLESLPDDACALLETTSTPTEELLRGYWQDALDVDPRLLQSRFDRDLATVHAARVPYLFVSGGPLDQSVAAHYAQALPDVELVELGSEGTHFPQLADPERFAEVLARTATFRQPLALSA
jgi:pimeloyl-ACP methyl ester carboxylesterase